MTQPGAMGNPLAQAANPLAQPQPMAQPQVAPQPQPGPQAQQYTKPEEVPLEELGTHRDPWAQHRNIVDREKARKAREGSTRKTLERYGL